MARRSRKADYNENPEWTVEDFRRAKHPQEALPKEVLNAFKAVRGPQKSPKKVPVSIRLSPEVVDHFRATGPGWQGRIDDTLRKVITRRLHSTKR
jgi:uncharacterized protein (DUF4415 family)